MILFLENTQQIKRNLLLSDPKIRYVRAVADGQIFPILVFIATLVLDRIQTAPMATKAGASPLKPVLIGNPSIPAPTMLPVTMKPEAQMSRLRCLFASFRYPLWQSMVHWEKDRLSKPVNIEFSFNEIVPYLRSFCVRSWISPLAYITAKRPASNPRIE